MKKETQSGDFPLPESRTLLKKRIEEELYMCLIMEEPNELQGKSNDVWRQ